MLPQHERKQYLNEVYRDYKVNPAFDKIRQGKRFIGGSGPVDARVMLVGEAPGPDENAAGRPFVGPSGEILDLLIKRSGMRRDELYITNTVKYQTVKETGYNRHPTKQEITDSLPCLKREIVIVDPLVLALMGKTAISAFFPMHDPFRDHGLIFRLTPTSRPVVMLFHPGVVIYSNGMKQTLIDDFKRITEALREQSGGDDLKSS